MSEWHDYYVIIGTAGSTLIGIQFIVITLLATVRARRTSHASLGAFATPTVVNLAGALVIAALMTAPWPSAMQRAAAVGIFGAIALAYDVLVRRHARRQTSYAATRADWVWYVLFPSLVHAAVVAAAALLQTSKLFASFTIAGSALGLLLIGTHNAWDTVTYLVLADANKDDLEDEQR